MIKPTERSKKSNRIHSTYVPVYPDVPTGAVNVPKKKKKEKRKNVRKIFNYYYSEECVV